MASIEDRQQALKDGVSGPPELADVNKNAGDVHDEIVAMAGGPLSLDDRISALEADMVEVKQHLPGVGRPLTDEEVQAIAERNAQNDEHKQAVAAEREIRRFVRRDGGFRAGLQPQQIARAKELLSQAGRPVKGKEKPKWDLILIPYGAERKPNVD